MTPGRGTQRGHEAIPESVRRQTYGAGRHLANHRRFHRDAHVFTAGTIELRFVDSGELAERFEAAAAFTVRDGRVTRMEPHVDLASALATAGVDEADEVRGA